MPETEPRAVLTPKEAARYLRIAHTKVYDLLRKQELIGKNFGTPDKPRWRILRSELDRFLSTPEETPAAAIARKLNRPAPSKHFQ